MKGIKKFYEELYEKKRTDEYRKIVQKRQKDFFHKYLLFFLNPYKNTRHDIVRKIMPEGEKYLDIGCWDGSSTLSYGAKDKFREVYGVDISEPAINEARRKGIKASIVDINSEKLPYPENFFDVITFVAVIEHLVEPYNILGEIKRVLKSGGILIMGTANVASLSNRLRILFGHRPRTSFDDGWDGGHLLYFTPHDLKDLLKKYDFKVLEKHATGNIQWLRKLLFPLTGEFIFKCRLEK